MQANISKLSGNPLRLVDLSPLFVLCSLPGLANMSLPTICFSIFMWIAFLLFQVPDHYLTLSSVFYWRQYGRERIWLSWQVAQFSLVSPWYCCSVAQSADCSMPGFSVHHQLSEFAQSHVHWVWWWHPTISSSVVPFSSCPWSFPASRSFPMSRLFPSGGQSIGVSASVSVFSMNI